jgi:polyhydroxyalkanoate synthesis regulator phasin
MDNAGTHDLEKQLYRLRQELDAKATQLDVVMLREALDDLRRRVEDLEYNQ